MAELQDRIQTLKRRWEANPSSRVFLQLAEEYRHRGLLAEALEVLERGIKQHPTYPSALVSLGRCYLELERPDAACTALEQVIQQDATHMVANKLLVEAYLGLGRADAAHERLRHYSLLNDGDPEIDSLEERIEKLMRSTPESGPAGPSGGEIVTQEVDEVMAATTAPGRSLPAPAPEPEGASPVKPGARRASVGAAVGGDEPFAGLDTATQRQRYLEGLMAEGLFPPTAAGNGGQRERTEREDEPEPPVSRSDDTDAEPTSVEASPEELDALAPPTREAEELADTEGAAQPVEMDAAGPSVLEVEVDAVKSASGADELAPAAGGASSDPATATLGKMYLEQGHLEMAERAFRQVLSRRPEDETALDGLQEVGRRRAGGLTGRQLLGASEPPPGVSDPAAKRIQVLKSYLQRIRGPRETDVSRAPDSDQ